MASRCGGQSNASDGVWWCGARGDGQDEPAGRIFVFGAFPGPLAGFCSASTCRPPGAGTGAEPGGLTPHFARPDEGRFTGGGWRLRRAGPRRMPPGAQGTPQAPRRRRLPPRQRLSPVQRADRDRPRAAKTLPHQLRAQMLRGLGCSARPEAPPRAALGWAHAFFPQTQSYQAAVIGLLTQV